MNMILPSPADVSSSIEQIRDICKIAWTKGIMAGWSGNASLRISSAPELMLITAAGSAKGRLNAGDFLLISVQGEIISGDGRASSESQLHTFLYKKWSGVGAILHTHPPFMQALELWLQKEASVSAKAPEEQFLNLALYEARIWRERLYFAEDYPPGTSELALGAIKGIERKCCEKGKRGEPDLPFAVWLPHHGLCAAAKNPKDCLCLTEELEHLAQIQLLSR